MKGELLKIEHLTASYGEEPVLKDILLGIGEGESVFLVGESGSGKSSLLRAVLGMENLTVVSGRVLYDGKDITAAGGKQRRELLGREIGFVPQNPAGSFNPLRRYEAQIRDIMGSHGLTWDPEEVTEILEKLDLKEGKKLLRMRPYEMSGGMNQRMEIASAMLLKTRILLCDEVTSALDTTTAARVVKELGMLCTQRKTALLMATHHLGIAARLADRIGIIKDGRMTELGDTDRILTAPREVYTKQLLMDVPRLGRGR